jgi:hypothetical protein
MFFTFFMPEYYPLRILLSGAFPENFLSAVLGRIVGGWSGYKSWDLHCWRCWPARVAHADKT